METLSGAKKQKKNLVHKQTPPLVSPPSTLNIKPAAFAPPGATAKRGGREGKEENCITRICRSQGREKEAEE